MFFAIAMRLVPPTWESLRRRPAGFQITPGRLRLARNAASTWAGGTKERIVLQDLLRRG